MATLQEKIAAAEKALALLGATDPAEAERFVALFDSQAALLPVPEPAPPPEERPAVTSAVAVNLQSDDPAVQTRIDAWNAEGTALISMVVQSDPA